MNRLGFRVQEAQALLPRIRNGNRHPRKRSSTSAELLNDPSNGRQVAAFREVASQFPESGVALELVGIFLRPQFHFDVVRPGAA
jgi:alanine racemase